MRLISLAACALAGCNWVLGLDRASSPDADPGAIDAADAEAGDDAPDAPDAAPPTINAVVAGGNHTCILRGDAVRCWGLGLYGRLGLAAAYKLSGLQARRKSAFKIDFKVDPTAPFSVRNVPAFDLRK